MPQSMGVALLKALKSTPVNQEVVLALIKTCTPADLAIQDTNGECALHLAARKNLPEIIKNLLKEGANPRTRGRFYHYLGQTPIEVAAAQGSWEAVRVFLELDENGFTLDSDTLGAVLLHYLAVQSSQHPVSPLDLALTRALLEAGANPNYVPNPSQNNRACYAALHFAILLNNFELIKLLFLFGANSEIRNSNGYTPAVLAANAEKWDLLKTYSEALNKATIIQTGKPLTDLLSEKLEKDYAKSKEDKKSVVDFSNLSGIIVDYLDCSPADIKDYNSITDARTSIARRQRIQNNIYHIQDTIIQALESEVERLNKKYFNTKKDGGRIGELLITIKELKSHLGDYRKDQNSTTFKTQLSATIKKQLPKFDKYQSWGKKIGLWLVNGLILCSLFFPFLKHRLTGGGFFFSMTGKTKELGDKLLSQIDALPEDGSLSRPASKK